MDKLTLKQKAFADNYIISGNATDAAKQAGYSEKTARQMGAENLSKPYILEFRRGDFESGNEIPRK